jgi:undecaprenyl-diphosphatase
MSTLQAIVLGLIQGITEFLPISSSGHLLIAPWLLGWQLTMSLDLEKTFDVALHLGTFIAIVVLMRVEVWRILKAFFGSIRRRKIESKDEKLAWLLVISTIPAALVGVAFESFIEEKLGQPWLVAILMIAFGFVLWAADSLFPRLYRLSGMRWYHALIIGVAQALALAPGVSRSGVTLSALRFLKTSRRESVRYAFLLSIPIIGGSALYKGAKLAVNGGLPSGTALPFVIGIVTAAVSGYLAAWFLLSFIKTHSFRGFVWYRFAFGALILLLILAGVRSGTLS